MRYYCILFFNFGLLINLINVISTDTVLEGARNLYFNFLEFGDMMYKRLSLLVITLLLFSCSNDPNTMINHLNGYWEIDEVTLSDGTKKDYNFNDTIDYIEVSDSLSGFRRKLKPNLFGTFETSRSEENFSIKIEDDSLNIYYTTPYSKWKETILNANETQLIILNNTNKDVYIYKRYESLDLDFDTK
ncbi:MAG: hypothetical protein ACJAZK_000881 [Psychroserpens sp.]